MKRILVFGVDPYRPLRSREITSDLFFSHYGGNTGNILFGRTAAQYLKQDDNSVTYGIYDLLTKEFAARVNDQNDALVLPLANHLGHHLKDELEALTHLVKSAKIPVIVMGIGAQSTYDYSFDFLRGLETTIKDFFSAVLERSTSVAVRGAFTAESLAKIGFAQHVRVTGCPSFYATGPDLSLSQPQLDRPPRVVFNYSKRSAKLFQQFAAQLPEPSPFITQYIPDNKHLDAFTLEMARSGRLHIFGDFDTWSEFHARHDFTISSRIHGSIISILSGVPAFLLADDSRTREMAEFFGIPFAHPLSFDANSNVLDLISGIDLTNLNNGYKSKYASFASFLDENGLPHNLHLPDAGGNLMPKALPDHPTEIALDETSVCMGILDRLEDSNHEIERLTNLLHDSTKLSNIIRRSIGTLIGIKNVKSLKRLLQSG